MEKVHALQCVLLLLPAIRCDPDIPKLLVTSHAKSLDAVPLPLKGNILQWQNLNPEFTLRYFDDAEQAEYMESNCKVPRCLQAYNLLESGAAKADMFRIAFLYYNGGWWFDSDVKAGSIATQCDLHAASESIRLFLVREPKNGHVRFMLIGGNRHPFLLANLYRQINNVIEAKKNKNSARALFITGPFTLGKTICDPLRYLDPDTIITSHSASYPDDKSFRRSIYEETQEIASHCDNTNIRTKSRAGYFSGKILGEKPPTAHNTSWKYTFGTHLFIFRFDVCSAYWHRPGARNMVYQDVLKSMNVTHHLQIPARRRRYR